MSNPRRSRMAFAAVFACLSFGEVQAQTQSVTSLILTSSETNQKIADVKAGSVLNLATLPTRKFSIRAVTYPSQVGSVRFGLNTNTNYRVESVAPYTMTGDDSRLYPLTWTPTVGSYSVTATPYSLAKATGTKGTPLAVNFKILDQAPTVAATIPTTIPAGLIKQPTDLAQITGKTYNVSSLSGLNSALAVAQGGDGIKIASGTYDWGTITVKPSTLDATRPLIIRSGNGPVTFKGTSKLVIQRSNVHLQGLSFSGGNGISVQSTTSTRLPNVRMSMIHCKGLINVCLIVSKAQDARFDHSLIEESQGKSMHISNESFRARVDHNVLRNIQKGATNNGYEAIQVGHGYQGDFEDQKARIVNTSALIDHNILQNVGGEGEMIGFKTHGNKAVANVILDSELGHLSFRGGGYNLAYGNIFRKTKGGIRVTAFTPRVLQNLMVDPQDSWEGIFLYVGSDTAFTFDYNGSPYTSVETIAARDGIVRNNSVILTPKITGIGSSVIGMAERTNTSGCGSAKAGYYIPCDVHPFNNQFVRNVVVNDRKHYAVKFSSAFQSGNTMASNAYAVSGTAKLSDTSTVKGFAQATSTVATKNRSLSEFVWLAPQDKCLRIPSASGIDSTQGSMYVAGSCETASEAAASATYWKNLDLLGTNKDDHTAFMNKIKTMPALVAPKLPKVYVAPI